MSSKLTHPSESADSHAQDDSVTAAELLELLGDEYTRQVLRAVVEQPRSGSEVTDAANVSKATAYRRLDALEEAGLVVSETVFDPDGHHHERYRAVVEAIELGFEAGDLTAELVAERDQSRSQFPASDRGRTDD
jgi:DNA-binding transcriptional ArsR family regulator